MIEFHAGKHTAQPTILISARNHGFSLNLSGLGRPELKLELKNDENRKTLPWSLLFPVRVCLSFNLSDFEFPAHHVSGTVRSNSGGVNMSDYEVNLKISVVDELT